MPECELIKLFLKQTWSNFKVQVYSLVDMVRLHVIEKLLVSRLEDIVVFWSFSTLSVVSHEVSHVENIYYGFRNVGLVSNQSGNLHYSSLLDTFTFYLVYSNNARIVI